MDSPIPLLLEGAIAPDFVLQDAADTSYRLYDLLEHRPVVLYFYPRDHTRGCIQQACSFRDSYDVFTHHGVEVLGVSSNSAESHARFAEEYHLPFPLLCDPGGKVRKLFGAQALLGLMSGRVTYVIGQDRRIKHRYSNMFNAAAHADEALSVVKTLTAQAPRAAKG